jgi:hypothetical protein
MRIMMRHAVVNVSSVMIAALLNFTTVVVQAQEQGGGGVQEQQQQQHYTCAFTALQLETDLILEHVKNQDENTYTMRLTYTGGLGWVSIGINSKGDTGMIPATAIIGRVEYDADGTYV